MTHLKDWCLWSLVVSKETVNTVVRLGTSMSNIGSCTVSLIKPKSVVTIVGGKNSLKIKKKTNQMEFMSDSSTTYFIGGSSSGV